MIFNKNRKHFKIFAEILAETSPKFIGISQKIGFKMLQNTETRKKIGKTLDMSHIRVTIYRFELDLS